MRGFSFGQEGAPGAKKGGKRNGEYRKDGVAHTIKKAGNRKGRAIWNSYWRDREKGELIAKIRKARNRRMANEGNAGASKPKDGAWGGKKDGFYSRAQPDLDMQSTDSLLSMQQTSSECAWRWGFSQGGGKETSPRM